MIYSPSQTKLKAVVTACVKCRKRPSVVGLTRCQKCRDWNKASAKRVQERRRLLKLCLSCGKNPKSANHNRCRPCLDVIKEATYTVKLKEKYGLTPQTLRKLYDKQGGYCAYCGLILDGKYCVDHCHTTNKVRGLLHHGCNVMLGFLEKHGRERLISMTDTYLGGIW
jgi:hypothetical protein